MRVAIKEALFAARFFLASKSLVDDEAMIAHGAVPAVSLDPSPVVVHDLQDSTLFYEFHVLNANEGIVGAIRCAADSTVGAPVFGYTTTVIDRDIDQRARERFAQDYRGATEISSRLVCYSFPKVAVEVSTVIDGSKNIFLYDVHTLEHLFTNPDYHSLTLSKKEGFAIKSYLDSIREGSDAEAFFEKGFKQMRSIVLAASETRLSPASLKSLASSPRDFEDAEYEYLSKYFKKNPPTIRSLVLPVRLYAQETRDYCAMASAQMIFSYAGIDMTQDEIAALMHHGPGGADPADQLRAFGQVFADRMDVNYDRDPTWEEAVDALELNLPFKSAVGLHARVCRGWKRFDYLDPATKRPVMSEYYLLINDPNPVGKGQIYWEATKIHIYRNAVTFKPR